MSQKIQVYKGKVKHKGLFDFGSLYEFLYDNLIDEGFTPHESKYYEMDRGDSKQVEIAWEADKRISDYFQIQITAYWIILGLKDVEVEKEGKKIKMQSATLEISVKCLLIKDPKDLWAKQPWKFLRKMYDEYIIKKRIEQYEDLAIEDITDFLNYIRSALAIEPILEGRKYTLHI